MQDTSEVLTKIIHLLNQHKVSYDRIVHKPVYTSQEAAEIRDTDPSIGAKALVFSADGKAILIVIPGNQRADTKKFKKEYGIKDLRMLTAAEIKELIGLEIGAIPPMGNLMGLETYFDQSLTERSWIAFNAGSHTQSVKMKTEDYLRLCKPEIGNFITQ